MDPLSQLEISTAPCCFAMVRLRRKSGSRVRHRNELSCKNSFPILNGPVRISLSARLFLARNLLYLTYLNVSVSVARDTKVNLLLAAARTHKSLTQGCFRALSCSVGPIL